MLCYWDGQRWCGPPVPGPTEDPQAAAARGIQSLFAWSVIIQVFLGLAWLAELFFIVTSKLSGWDGRPLVEDYPSWLSGYWWYLFIAPVAAGVSLVGRNTVRKDLIVAATVCAAIPVAIGWAAISVST